MPADNQVVLVGNLTDEPELRFTPTGTPVGSYRLAVTARVRDGEAGARGNLVFRVNQPGESRLLVHRGATVSSAASRVRMTAAQADGLVVVELGRSGEQADGQGVSSSSRCSAAGAA